jgi:hypothetical protein
MTPQVMRKGSIVAVAAEATIVRVRLFRLGEDVVPLPAIGSTPTRARSGSTMVR